MAIRYQLYQKDCFKKTSVNAPVIIVGNITVGGTGKTPLVIYLARLLQSQGYRPGIISRGYGGCYRTPYYSVQVDSDPAVAGDEPVLLKQNLDCPLVVSKSRVLAAKTLLEQYDCNVILSDDGLQHYALSRDIEIAVIDGVRRFGNGFCLPAGPLREPLSRLNRVDFRVTQGRGSLHEFRMRLIPGAFKNLKDHKKIFKQPEGATIHAVAGIGHPERFFKTLEKYGFEFVRHKFPDHYAFTEQDFGFLEDGVVIMTEKDAVKCASFADERYWYLPVEAKVDKAFDQLFLGRLSGILSRK